MRAKTDAGLPSVTEHSGEGKEPTCPECHHKAVGIFPGPVSAKFLRFFQRRGSIVRCPSWWTDLDGVGDAAYCNCRHISHASGEAIKNDNAHYLGEL